MERISNITGLSRFLFNIRIRAAVFLHFIPDVIRGKTTVHMFVRFLGRMIYFIDVLKHNKFVRIGKNTRIDLYVPGFPSKAFYTACQKFFTFGKKLPNTTVLISVTSACRFHCHHCYQKYDKGADVALDKLLPVVKQLQDMGIAFFNIEGGDPFLVYDRLKAVCSNIDDRSEIWINSTGDGITKERLAELKQLGLTAIMFSMHEHDRDAFNRFMGSDKAWDIFMQGVEDCHACNVPVALNICLTRTAFYDGTFEKSMDMARKLKASIIQLIKPKPAGGWLEIGPEQFSQDDLKRIKQMVDKYNLDIKYSKYPSISAQAIEESPSVFGCTAGGTDRFYINAKGDVQPCEFLNISFGNIADESFEIIYNRMREQFEGPGECWLCEKYSGDILRVKQMNEIQSLPLDKEVSKVIYNKWDRGHRTFLYEKLEK